MPTLEGVKIASKRLEEVVLRTPLQPNANVSEAHKANVYLKREDLQTVRSYKIRGAFNKISTLGDSELSKGIVCASAGNHAQGVALSCKKLKVHGVIFMPVTTPSQKVEQVRMFGAEFVEVKLVGDTFDDSKKEALLYSEQHKASFIHPFDDPLIIEGQGTVGIEILEQVNCTIDYLLVPIGGGGLASGICTVFKELSPKTKIIGVEPQGAGSMSASIAAGRNVELDSIEKFVDGASVARVGDLPFEICKDVLDQVIKVPEGKVCETILRLYNKDAIVVEPAGALTLAALDQCQEEINGKNVVCVVSGSNNDITRTAEIRERAILYQGLKHYFIVRFPQRAGALKEFVVDVLGPKDDIVHFEYTKKSSRENGSAVVGIELAQKSDFEPLIEKMKSRGFFSEYLNAKSDLFRYLV